jgi:PAS domain S-box-containing protein
VRDISKEKAAEQDLIDSRNFLNNIIETVAAPIFVKDQRHRWVMMNEKFSQLIGIERGKLLGKTDKDFLPADEARVFWNMDNAVLKTNKPIVNEETITSANGEVHDLLTIKTCYRNEQGKKFIIGFITDVTTLRRAEAELKKLHASLRAILESSKESIFAVDNKCHYTAFNKHHQETMRLLYGAEIRIGGNKLRYLKDHPDAKWVKAELRRALRGEHFVTEHYQDLPAYKGYILITYNPIVNEEGQVTGVAVFIRDITERKRFEEIIKGINDNLRAVMESTADRILAVDRNMKYIMFNRSYASRVQAHTGRTPQVGDNFLDVLPHELVLHAKRSIMRGLQGEQYIDETRLVNGSVFETSYNPIRNETGQVSGVAMFVRDVTEKRRIEETLKQLNEELSQQNLQLGAQEEELKATLEELSERNFELDQLMYKTSHDLRSPLSSVMGLINLAHLDNDAKNYPEYFKKIEGRIKKLDEFISSMLNYARVNRADLQAEEIKLERVVSNCIRELEYLDNFDRIQTDIEIKNHTIPFRSDKLRVDIIFSNLISNAYKYYNPEADSYLRIRIELHPERADIAIEDNGIGIRPEHQDKIFNMFYRATDRSQGSGLGMYIVKQAVEKLRGNIKVSSEFGKGTCISITLPNNP